MGAIERGSERYALAAQCTIGRDARCHVVLPGEAVSSFHASLVFRDGRWWVRDLGSTNGTFVNGHRLAAGGPAPLKRGDLLAFAVRTQPWVLIDDGPPALEAIRARDGARRAAIDGVLALPDEDEPLRCIVEQAPGSWHLVSDAGDRPIHDQQQLIIGTDAWTLLVPSLAAGTAPLGHADWDVAEAVLEFAVSADEEKVRVTVHHGTDRLALGPKAEFYLLLTLARERLSDVRKGMAEEDAGWIEVGALCDAMRISESHLNIQVHRARNHLSSLRALGPGGIIDRGRTGQLRIATGRLRVQTV